MSTQQNMYELVYIHSGLCDVREFANSAKDVDQCVYGHYSIPQDVPCWDCLRAGVVS